jgi:hypothetical protein
VERLLNSGTEDEPLTKRKIRDMLGEVFDKEVIESNKDVVNQVIKELTTGGA